MTDRHTALAKLGITKPPQITEAELKHLTLDEIALASEKGLLDDLKAGFNNNNTN